MVRIKFITIYDWCYRLLVIAFILYSVFVFLPQLNDCNQLCNQKYLDHINLTGNFTVPKFK